MVSFKLLFLSLGVAASLSMARAADETATNAPKILRVSTGHSALTLRVGRDGRVYQLRYGMASSNAPSSRRSPARETEFYPPYGDGYVLDPAVQATHVDGNTSTDLIYVNHETTRVDDNVTLTRVELRDRYYPFFVNLYFKAYANEDVIEEWTDFRHDEEGTVTLYRFASSASLVKAREYWVTQFHGDWAREAEMSEERLTPGIKVLDSKIGVRASKFRIPSFILALNGPAQETNGEVFGGSLEWSGSYELAFEVDSTNRLHVLSGINPFASEYHLAHGRTFTTPAMLWTWSGHGKGQVSRNFHRWARRYGIRDGAKPRPVLLNNWEATQFDFDENKLVSLFDGAKELGFELFLLDDGWFGNKYPRNGDAAGLGDWQANTNKLPHGLSYLTEQAARRGLRFGIWLEPEMVNPRSELYEKHPDWVIGQPHREPELSRHQLDLDLSNPQVKEFAWKVIDGTLGDNPGISYVKWDANRYVTQPGSTWLKPGEQSHLLIDYNFALYDIMG
ncbi:MAG TPA: alpha-galactosidase, partial [Candidatus Saccharimonadales bacterium]|nr:alpha-galactosidase [Candidatus Saccharimonadales bacterium]